MLMLNHSVGITCSTISLFPLFSSSSSSSGSNGDGVREATKCQRMSCRHVVWITLHSSQLNAWQTKRISLMTENKSGISIHELHIYINLPHQWLQPLSVKCPYLNKYCRHTSIANTLQADFLSACLMATSRPSKSWCWITKAKTGHWKFLSPLLSEPCAEISLDSSGEGCRKSEDPTSV